MKGDVRLNARGIARRGFIAGVGTSAVGLTVLSATAKAVERPVEIDVAVVGAGFAGLSASRRIARAGYDVLLLEPRDRVVDRAVNRSPAGGRSVEAGGTHIGPTQDRMRAPAEGRGRDEGRPILSPDRGGERSEDERLAVFEDVVAWRESLAGEVDPRAPWETTRAAEWDSQTFQTWLDANSDRDGAELITAAGHTLWRAEPRELSLLFVTSCIAAAGHEDIPDVTFDNSPDAEVPAVLARFVGGHGARAWSMRPLEEQRAYAFAPFAVMFGDEALSPTEYSKFSGVRRKVQAAALSSSRLRPVGSIRWAGRETSDYWAGYMEVAVRLGRGAPDEAVTEPRRV